MNYFLTNQYERYLNNNFGANLKAFIFEQISNDNLSFLRDDIQNKINLYFTNIEVEDLQVDSLPDINVVTVKLTYNIPNTAISDKIEITF